MIELRGKHVALRALEREHCHTLWEMTEIAEDVPTEHVQPGLAQENADKWFEEIQGKQGQTGVDLGVFTLEGKIIGHVQLHGIDWQDRSAELGLGFARVSDRGKGYGTNALQLIVRYAFDHLGLHRLASGESSGIQQSRDPRARKVWFPIGGTSTRCVFLWRTLV